MKIGRKIKDIIASALVLLGVLLLKAGLDQLEPRVGAKAWIRRTIMAVLMLAAMTLYSLAK